MKLLICASEYFPHGSGIANVIYNVVEQLKKQGVGCTICSPTGPDITLGNKKLIDKFGFLGLLYYWYQVSQFFIKKNHYDVVWLQNPYFISHNPFNCCLVTMHSTYYGMSNYRVGNSFFLRLYYKIVAILERYCLGKINKTSVFTGGELVCEELEKKCIGKDQLICIPNGVDIQYFKPINDRKLLRKKLNIPQDDIILLSVGRLTPAKQPQTLINVFSFLEKRMSNLTLCIAGTGELLDSIKKMALEAGLKKVIFLGHVDHNSRLPGLYADSDYFIMTSVYEGGMPPLTLSEAMASGLPCIVSDTPNLGVVTVANCGIVVNFEDVEKASDQIYAYLTGIHQDHSKNARKYAEENLDWTTISEHYFAALKKQCNYPIEQ